MKNIKNKLLFSTVSVLVAGAASSAMAFDKINWQWNSSVNDNITRNITIDPTIETEGLTQIEKIQVQIGDVTATSNVHDINNNTVGADEDGIVTIDEVVTVTGTYASPGGPGHTSDALSGHAITANDATIQASYINDTGVLSEGANGFTEQSDIRLQAEIDVSELESVQDAADLPLVESLATAVGNNQAIASNTSVSLHDGQFLFGGFGESVGQTELPAINPDAGNNHARTTSLLTMAAAMGALTPATIGAKSHVYDITNAAVESVATAVGNNMSVDVENASAASSVVMGDITQFAYADVTAESMVNNIGLNNYSGLGAAGFGAGVEDAMAVISSSATAVGNNLAITVSTPDVE